MNTLSSKPVTRCRKSIARHLKERGCGPFISGRPLGFGGNSFLQVVGSQSNTDPADCDIVLVGACALLHLQSSSPTLLSCIQRSAKSRSQARNAF